jgi:HAD superfamily hydrolase (TIGR01458 family)
MSPLPFATSAALLIDLDGVLYIQETLIPGAIDTIHFIQRKNIPHRFVTNTSTYSRHQILTKLARVGIVISPDDLFTAPVAAAQYLSTLPDARCYFFTSPNLREDFVGIASVKLHPTHVVIGDVGKRFSYTTLNNVFRMILDGAEMVALQKNRFWTTTEGLTLDAGAFVAALEYATGKTARLFGKPAEEFFLQACASLRSSPPEVIMVGDDLKADIAGAAAAGLQTVFVRTGKDKDTSLDNLEYQPDVVLHSIAELPAILEG